MRRILKWALIVVLTSMLAVSALICLFAVVDPPVSALMMWRAFQGNGFDYRLVGLEAISPHLVHAVLTSEDNRFCDHHGIDWAAVETAIDEAGERPRGASTITMQTAKNLFLWPERRYVRKAIEAPLALLIDLVWPKRRIIEVYLNIAEWGPGIYGAEAAARHHFARPASQLDRNEAALLAAALPAPHERIAGRPGPVTRRIAARIENRMAQTNGLFACVGQLRARTARNVVPFNDGPEPL